MRHPLMDHIIQEHGPVMGNRVNQRRLPITVKVFLGRRIHDQSERAVCRPAAAIRLSTAAPVPAATALCSPAGRTRTQRGLLKYVLLGLVTFSIYDIWQMSEVGDSLNLLAFKRDGKHTMHYCLMFFLVGWVTLGIGWLVWYHRVSDRIGEEQAARGLPVTVTASTFWLWGILGSLIAVGPFIYIYKLLHAMNDLSADYNVRGF